MSYFRVVVGTSNEAAELYLYGIIGQEKWWTEEEDEEALTDLAVVRAIRSLEEEYSRINIRINSPGGMLYHGDAIISAIMNSRAEIHTYNDGIAASMAADIWLCCKNRHMPMHAKTMLHNTSTLTYGNAKQLRREADIMEKMDGISVAMLSMCTGMSEEEVSTKFYNYEDNWLTAKDCLELGLIPQIEDYSSSDATIPEAPERMSAAALLRFYGQALPDAASAPNAASVPGTGKRSEGLLQRMTRTLFGSTEPSNLKPDKPDSPQSQANDMNIDELRRSLDDSSITEDQLLDLVRERGYTAERKASTETPPPAAAQEPTANDARYAELERKLDELMNITRQQGQRPGAKPAAGAADADVHEDNGNALEAYNKRLSQAAANKEYVAVVK